MKTELWGDNSERLCIIEQNKMNAREACWTPDEGQYKMSIVSLLLHSLASASIMLWSYEEREG